MGRYQMDDHYSVERKCNAVSSSVSSSSSLLSSSPSSSSSSPSSSSLSSHNSSTDSTIFENEKNDTKNMSKNNKHKNKNKNKNKNNNSNKNNHNGNNKKYIGNGSYKNQIDFDQQVGTSQHHQQHHHHDESKTSSILPLHQSVPTENSNPTTSSITSRISFVPFAISPIQQSKISKNKDNQSKSKNNMKSFNNQGKSLPITGRAPQDSSSAAYATTLTTTARTTSPIPQRDHLFSPVSKSTLMKRYTTPQRANMEDDINNGITTAPAPAPAPARTAARTPSPPMETPSPSHWTNPSVSNLWSTSPLSATSTSPTQPPIDTPRRVLLYPTAYNNNSSKTKKSSTAPSTSAASMPTMTTTSLSTTRSRARSPIREQKTRSQRILPQQHHNHQGTIVRHNKRKNSNAGISNIPTTTTSASSSSSPTASTNGSAYTMNTSQQGRWIKFFLTRKTRRVVMLFLLPLAVACMIYIYMACSLLAMDTTSQRQNSDMIFEHPTGIGITGQSSSTPPHLLPKIRTPSPKIKVNDSNEKKDTSIGKHKKGDKHGRDYDPKNKEAPKSHHVHQAHADKVNEKEKKNIKVKEDGKDNHTKGPKHDDVDNDLKKPSTFSKDVKTKNTITLISTIATPTNQKFDDKQQQQQKHQRQDDVGFVADDGTTTRTAAAAAAASDAITTIQLVQKPSSTKSSSKMVSSSSSSIFHHRIIQLFDPEQEEATFAKKNNNNNKNGKHYKNKKAGKNQVIHIHLPKYPLEDEENDLSLSEHQEDNDDMVNVTATNVGTSMTKNATFPAGTEKKSNSTKLPNDDTGNGNGGGEDDDGYEEEGGGENEDKGGGYDHINENDNNNNNGKSNNITNDSGRTVTPISSSSAAIITSAATAATWERQHDNNHSQHNPQPELQQCQPMADWQTQSFVNCNTFHELDIRHSIGSRYKKDIDERQLNLLGQGWFRMTWKYSTEIPNYNHNSNGRQDENDDEEEEQTTEESMAIKTLRMEREFLEEYYELHRRDAVAMERLTFSPFVMNVYGYCGQSAINELASFQPDVTSLEQLDRRMRSKGNNDIVLLLKLRLAVSVSVGLFHVHQAVNMDRSGNNTSLWELLMRDTDDDAPAIMAHYDINPRNIALTKGGKPKLNDFNIAEFLQVPSSSSSDATTTTTGRGRNNSTTSSSLSSSSSSSSTCGTFRSRLHEPWWRAPEEMDMSGKTRITEKVDVYALGNVLYHILTTHSPRGKMKKERIDEVRGVVTKGKRPMLPDWYEKSKNPTVKAFRRAMDICFEPNPRKRGTARQVARILYEALTRQVEERKRQQQQQQK